LIASESDHVSWLNARRGGGKKANGAKLRGVRKDSKGKRVRIYPIDSQSAARSTGRRPARVKVFMVSRRLRQNEGERGAPQARFLNFGARESSGK